MNTSLSKTIEVLAAIIVIILISVSLSKNAPHSFVGSVASTSEYTPLFIAPNLQGTSGTLCSRGGTLGQVDITGAAAGYLEFYAATTSNSSLRTTVATTSLQKIASFPVSAAAVTHTEDVLSANGLIWEVTGTIPTTTIAYRCQP